MNELFADYYNIKYAGITYTQQKTVQTKDY